MVTGTANGNGNAPSALAIWGEREDVKEFATRIRKFMPGGADLTEEAALILAQYGLALDANVFRGEVYAYTNWKGQIVLVEGYKLLVRWAKRQGDYIERYEKLTDLPEGDIGARCFVLRKDNLATLQTLTAAGADFPTAFELAATYADGIVKRAEMVYSKGAKAGQPIDPPKGWTWEQVARKRALKTALNMAFGAPSPSEIARETWMVGNTETQPEDWTVEEFESDTPAKEREATAQLSATTRAALEEFAQLSEEEQQALLDTNRDLLRGSEEDQQGTLL